MEIKLSSGSLHPAIVTEAAGWFIEFRTGDTDGETRDRFMQWLRRSPEHIQAYLEVSGAWSELPTLDPGRKIDVAAMIARARAEADILPLSPTQRRLPRNGDSHRRATLSPLLGFRVAVAACAVLALIGVTLLMWDRGETYTTGIGEQRTVRLPDGSTFELNAQSEVHVLLSKRQRLLELREGQALFHVAKDRTHPFIVRTGSTSVRAVGTEFDVYRKHDGSTVVTVVEGSVAVYSSRSDERAATANLSPSSGTEAIGSRSASADPQRNGQVPARTSGSANLAGTNMQPTGETAPDAAAIFLCAGEQVTMSSSAVATAPRPVDAGAATAWVQKRLVFEETPLSEVADEFNRYNGRPLVIDDSELQRVRISGIYSSTDPASLLSFLRAQHGIQVIETDQTIQIKRRQ